jgi:hypothetical protein
MMIARHRLVAALSLACVLGVLGACGRANPGPTASAQPSGSGSTGVSPSPASSQTAHVAGARCVTAQLEVTVAPGTNAAGHIGLLLLFTNTSATACTMSGYPGVSFVTGPSGTQIGDAAERVGGPAAPVSLAPQGKARANLLLRQVGNYSADACRPTQAAGMRVYPPDETTAIYVTSARQVCSVPGTGFAQIYPVEAGP